MFEFLTKGIFLSFSILFIIPCFGEPTPAISRFGSPKHPSDFKELPYINPKAVKGGRLRLAKMGSFDSFNKDIAKGMVAEGILLTFDPLMKKTLDDPHTWYGVIAQKADMAHDYSSITFFIHPQAKFHDGSPIRSEDITFSIDLLMKQGVPRYRKYYSEIKTIHIIDSATVQITFKKKDGKYDPELPMIVAGLRVLSKKNLQDKNFQSTGLTPLLGSGPYKVHRFDPGRFVIYERVKDYWAADLAINKGQFNFDMIEIQYYKNTHSLFESFKAGEFDCYFESDQKQWHTGYDFKGIREGKVKKVELTHQRPVPVNTLIFNMNHPLFSDLRLRKALAYAFNFDTMNKAFFYGKYQRMTSLFANTDFDCKGHAPEDVLAFLKPYKENLDPTVFDSTLEMYNPNLFQYGRQALIKADHLLKQAGWIVKEGQRVHHQTGVPLVIDFMIKDQALEKVVLHYARDLKTLGIVLRPVRVDSVQYENHVLNRQFQMIFHTWSNSLSPGVEQAYYFSSETANLKGSSNYIGIKNPAIEALAKKVSLAKDEKELKLFLQSLNRGFIGMFYCVPGFYHNELCFSYWQERLEMPEISPEIGTNPMEWWWAKGQDEEFLEPSS